ncbi:carotenoid 1,2-hydratase [Sulfurimicrobium lacus]|uniref:Carotenoid 1,2-hydratase n=1 Tax=Sulfurimicrobium lacus TaxID=2715678 RepID=A0A6F8VF65_9PROT|nr:carotenoid 1,2-hydratase [Sulfurimicrobium lacus]BCB27592.1 carotenoid 1,2-hydratase [Sulfurimicrobium lacus]
MRALLRLLLLTALWPLLGSAANIDLARDAGSHPAARTEWWYVTGWLRTEEGNALGFQVTFFRSRTTGNDANPSRFAPRQILFAHAAISDPRLGHLLGDQRAARAGFGLAEAREGKTEVWIDDWSLRQADDGDGYTIRLPAREFSLALVLKTTQAPLLNGPGGLSRKAAEPGATSHYYSQPQLLAKGTVARDGKTSPVTGSAWLDHEWSDSYLEADAVGWDWVGLNLADGGALMLFRMRDRNGGTRWAGGSHRKADGSVTLFEPGDIRFTPLRLWRSPRSGTSYPVAWHIDAKGLEFDLEPMMDDQENDARATAGTIYWEGAVRALATGREIARGYLELTGYWLPLRL